MVAAHDAPDFGCAVAFVSKHKNAKVTHRNQMPAAFWAKDVRNRVAVALGYVPYVSKVLFSWRHSIKALSASSINSMGGQRI